MRLSVLRNAVLTLRDVQYETLRESRSGRTASDLGSIWLAFGHSDIAGNERRSLVLALFASKWIPLGVIILLIFSVGFYLAFRAAYTRISN
jgi:hypothetical protein